MSAKADPFSETDEEGPLFCWEERENRIRNQDRGKICCGNLEKSNAVFRYKQE